MRKLKRRHYRLGCIYFSVTSIVTIYRNGTIIDRSTVEARYPYPARFLKGAK